MQTRERKLRILKAVVEEYIKNGEPVGSKLLCTTLGFPVSSATVRNEMSELSEMGLLTQPHTSAGRQPSEAGFRCYVESLMEKKPLSGSAKVIVFSVSCQLPRGKSVSSRIVLLGVNTRRWMSGCTQNE